MPWHDKDLPCTGERRTSMQPPTWSADTVVSSGQSRTALSPLVGPWLLLARVVWWAVTLLVAVLFVAALPASFASLQTLCLSCNGPQLTPELARQLSALGLSLPLYAASFLALNSVFFAAYLVMACVLFWRRADDRIAFIGSLFLVSFGGAAFAGTLDALASLNPAWQLLISLARFLGIAFFILFSYLFPDGRFVPSWTRFLALVGLLVQVPDTFFPGSPLSFSHLPRLLTFVLFLSSLVGPVVVQVYRYRRVSNAVQRQQTKWVIFGLTVAIGGFLSLLLLTATVSPAGNNPVLAQLIVVSASYLFLLVIPLSLGIAVLRYRLWNIDIIIKRTLVYSILTACVVGIYVLVVGSLGAVFHTGSTLLISLGVTGLVAMLFQPLREWLQRGVNRLLYGQRDEPYRVISRLGQRLETTFTPDAVLSTIVETVALALKLPYAAILFQHDQTSSIAASYGRGNEEPLLRLPLLYQSQQVGELLLAPRARGETFTPADRRLLADLARQVGIAAHAVQLTTDLQRSRERLVTAREEERRRLRRDLHDGLGPALATITVKAEAARDAIEAEPAQAITLLEDLISQAQAAITDIRRLVYNLRPPALDDLGLVTAIRTPAMHYEQSGLPISVEAPESLPELPAAVEVATYRIMQEALTNVVRHANARSCLIRLVFDGMLHLEVRDDGCGISPHRQAGVGLRSMQERAVEVGGHCVVEALPGRGTRVQADLPCSSNGRSSIL